MDIRLNRPRLCFAFALCTGVLLLFLYPEFWRFFLGPAYYGEPPLYPFLDMHGRLAAFEAHRAGLDILHHPNPLDPLHRINVKPTWPLHLSFLGLGREQLAVAGFLTVAGFLGIVIALLRPTRWAEALLLFALCFSPPVLLGIERANDDLVYFILLAAVPVLLKNASNVFALSGAWVVIFLLAPAKYYPGAAFLLFFSEVPNWRRLGIFFAAGLLFVAAYASTHIGEILYLKDAVPKPETLLAHGASLIRGPDSGQLFAISLLAVIALLVTILPRWPTLPVSGSARRWFLLGFAVSVFCFGLNSNYDYRFVFLLPLLPLLMELARDRTAYGLWSTGAGVLMLALVPIFWLDIGGMHVAKAFGVWGPGVPSFTMALKQYLLLLFHAACTVIAATLLRPNLRGLVTQLAKETTSPRTT